MADVAGNGDVRVGVDGHTLNRHRRGHGRRVRRKPDCAPARALVDHRAERLRQVNPAERDQRAR